MISMGNLVNYTLVYSVKTSINKSRSSYRLINRLKEIPGVIKRLSNIGKWSEGDKVRALDYIKLIEVYLLKLKTEATVQPASVVKDKIINGAIKNAISGAITGAALDIKTGGFTFGSLALTGAITGAGRGALTGLGTRYINNHFLIPVNEKYLKVLKEQYDKHKDD